MKKLLIPLVIFLPLALICADTLSLPISRIAVITNNTISRVLLRFDTDTLSNVQVDYAEIVIPHFLTSGKIAIEGYRLTTNWNPTTVRWNSFIRPGGDYDTTSNTRYITSSSENYPIILNITEFIKNWLNSGNNYGILLKRPIYEGNGFTGNIQFLRNALMNAKVRIFYIP
jgi:hypothetical protein